FAIMNRPAPVEITYENLRFLITHNPTNATLSKFIEELKKYGVTTLVRVCDATYDQAPIEKEGIQVLVKNYPGISVQIPPPGQSGLGFCFFFFWLSALQRFFIPVPRGPWWCWKKILLLAGLPSGIGVFLLSEFIWALATLLGLGGFSWKRRGAFNSKQLLYLEKYRPKMRLRFKDANGHCCVQ
ncbi:TP4A2 phosphatase, partial [Sylvia atricapilla]|nr:TP4A2 phosphatase [Sylvia atricapilla]